MVKTEKIDEKRAKAIEVYINKNKELSDKVYTNRQVEIEVQGKPDVAHVYRLPRSLLRLNPDNHRFATDWANLKEDRIKSGKKADFDLDDENDIQEIRNVLTGKEPDNEPRRKTFNDLKEAMERLSTRSKYNDHNGQRDPGIITYDGKYVNANRRDTALEQLQTELKKRKKKTGVDVSKHDYINVGRCPRETTQDDIMSMEMAEQISKSVRDNYDYMNAGMLIQRKYNSSLKTKTSPSDTPTKRKSKEESAIQEVADKMEGIGTKTVREYLNFMKFVEGVLVIMRIPTQYNLVNRSSGAKVPISYLLKEASKEWDKIVTPRDKKNFMEEIAMECSLHQNEKTKGDFPVRSNYRDFRKAVNNSASKHQIRNAAEKYDFKNPDKAAVNALPVIQKALDKYSAENESKEPEKLLSKTLENMLAVDRAITTSNGAAQKLKIISQDPLRVKNIITIAEKIEKAITRHLKEIKSSGLQKKKQTKRKKKKAKSKKPKKRQSAGKHSRR